MLASKTPTPPTQNIDDLVKNPFKEFNKTGLFIANIDGANYERSKKLFDKYNLRPLSLREVLTVMIENPDLKERLKESRFFIENSKYKLSQYYSFYSNNHNTLKVGKGEMEKTLFVHGGNNSWSFYVATDHYTQFFESRYVLYSNTSPYCVLPVLIGFQKDRKFTDYSETSELHIQNQTNGEDYATLYHAAVKDAKKLTTLVGSSRIYNIIALLKFLGRK